jgi:hypothetical protein
MQITPYPAITVHPIHLGTSLCHLFFAAAPKSHTHQPNAQAEAEKSGLQAAANEDPDTEGNQRASA